MIEELYKKLEKCKKLDIKDVNINDLDDLSDIKIDTNMASIDRILVFLNTCKNPYMFKVGDSIVKISFSDTSLSAEDCILNAINDSYSCQVYK